MHFSFFTFFSFSCHIPGYTVFVSHFPRFAVFSPQFRSYSMYFSYFTFFTVTRHIPVSTVFLILHIFQCFSPYFIYYHVSFSFSSFVSFLHISQDLQCCLMLHVFQFSHHNPDPTVCISHISRFFTAIFHVLQCLFLSLHNFQCFSPYFMSYHVSVSFSPFVTFLAINQVLQCEFLFFQVGQFTRHIPGPTVCISYFSHF